MDEILTVKVQGNIYKSYIIIFLPPKIFLKNTISTLNTEIKNIQNIKVIRIIEVDVNKSKHAKTHCMYAVAHTYYAVIILLIKLNF